MNKDQDKKSSSFVGEQLKPPGVDDITVSDPFSGQKNITINFSASYDKPTEDQHDSQHFEDDGEDLPDNFFDDFSNKDFMEGLNVVDDWNDDDEVQDYQDVKTETKPTKLSSSRQKDGSPHKSHKDKKYDHYDNYRNRHSKDIIKPFNSLFKYASNTRKENYSRNRRSRSRNKHPQDISQQKGETRERRASNSDRNDKLSESLIDHRRDPEKTKRDIQRDKLRCAKDQEARVFQEQLKVAETGLVPPGTELDVVLNSAKFKAIDESRKNTPKEQVKETIKPKLEPKKEKPTEKRREEPAPPRTKISRSPEIKQRRRRAYARSNSRERSYSPKRKRKSTRSRERDYRRRENQEVDLRYRLREKRERFKTDGSPFSKRRLSRSPSPLSPISAISERESWLRNKDRYSRNRYSRSLSPMPPNPTSSRDRGGSPRRKAKRFSFMEEIEIKLRQTQPSRDPISFSIQNPSPLMSTPVPKPDFFQQQMNIAYPPNPQLYLGPPPSMCPPPDQFAQPIMMGADPNIMPPMFGITNAPSIMQHGIPNISFTIPQPVPAPHIFLDSNQNPPIQHHLVNVNSGTKQENLELAKLFEDKKISLSDFLSVSAKPLDPSAPVDIHNKIKVISRCQEAIKFLEDPKLTGRFIPKISQQVIDSEKRASENTKTTCQSPLRKAVVVRFNFTVPMSKRWTNCKTIDQISTRTTLHKLLSLLGIMEKPDLPSPVPSDSSSHQQPEVSPKPVPPPAPIIKVKSVNSFVQTEPVTCQICEIRSARKLSDGQTQTVKTTTCEVSTQVSIEDLTKSCTTFIPRGILKSNASSVQSISHLTPAQLLAQLDVEKKDEMNKSWSSMNKKEAFPAYGRSYAEQSQPTQSSINESFRNVSSFNDNFMGGDNSNSSAGMYSGSNLSSAGKFIPDRFGGNLTNTGMTSQEAGFLNNSARGNYGSNMNDSRGFDNFYNSGRQYQDSGAGSNSGVWNSPVGRNSNARGFGHVPNKYFNQRGPN